MQNSLNIALGYARLLDWAVFPVHSVISGKCTCGNNRCSNKGKHPATRNGVKDATKHDKQIERLWGNRTFLNVGIATGEISNIFVLDIDTDIDKETGMSGFEALAELEEKYGNLPPTPHQITGSGGLHYVFKFHVGIKNKGRIFPSIDIRGDGGYIVAAPSLHESGKEYVWELEHRPSDIDVADAPGWLIEKTLNKHKNGRYKAKPSEEYLNILQGVSDGERNNSLTSLIGHLLARKIDYRVAYELVKLWNINRVDPPLEEEVVLNTFNNLLRREVGKR